MGLFDIFKKGEPVQPHGSQQLPISPIGIKQTYIKGDVIGQRYLVYDVLGKGGCGIVYSVYDKSTQGVFALKTFLDQYMENSAVSSRFQKEAQVWVALERHPFIVTAFFVEIFSGRYYVALEYITQNEFGWNTLDEYLKNSTINLKQTLTWAIQFCHGMEYAYSKGISAHRDIKPANIMIDDNNNVRISDFGLAGIIYPDEVSFSMSGTTIHQTMIGTGMGTATHMPPEQFENAAGCDERSDIYSFGVVLFQMVNSGKLPFYTDNSSNFWTIMRHLHSEGEIPQSNAQLNSVIARCLQKAPSSRYQSFGILRTELESLLKQQYGVSVPVPQMPPKDIWELNNKSNNLNKLGMFEEAVKCANDAIGINDKDDNSWHYKGNALHNLGRYDEAIECYKHALKLNDQSGCWGNLGLSYRAKYDYENALACYDKVLSTDPDNIYTLNNKGACLAQSGRLQEAITCYDKGLSIDKSFSMLWTNKGIALVEFGDIDNGILCLNNSLSLNPNNIEVLRQKAEYLTKNNKLSDAKIVYCKLVELSKTNGNDWFNFGILLYNDNEIDKAINAFSRAEKLNTGDYEIKYLLMESYFKKEDAANTAKYCDELISANFHLDEAVSRKSSVLFYTGEKDKAFELLLSSLKNNPSLDLLWFALSNRYEDSSNIPESLKAANKCLQILNSRTDSSSAKIENIKEKIRRLEYKISATPPSAVQTAIQQLQNAEKQFFKQKPHTDAIKQVIQASMQAGDKLTALKYCDILIDTTKYITDFGNKAIVMSWFGDTAGAIKLLHEILNERPHLDSLWFILSDIYEKKGDIDAAFKAAYNCKKALQRSEKPNPQNLADVEARLNALRR